MKPKNRLKTNPFLYYPIEIFGFLFTIAPYVLIKLIAIVIATLLYIYFKEFWWSPLLSSVSFFLTLGLLFPIGKYLIGKGLLLSEFSKNYKKSYINDYGENLKEPSFEDFDLKPEEYYSFNQKFKLDAEFISFLTVPIVLISSLFLMSNRGIIPLLIVLPIVLIIYLVSKYLCLFINFKILSNQSKYNNIQAYNKSKFIFNKVQEELKDNKNAFKGWED